MYPTLVEGSESTKERHADEVRDPANTCRRLSLLLRLLYIPIGVRWHLSKPVVVIELLPPLLPHG